MRILFALVFAASGAACGFCADGASGAVVRVSPNGPISTPAAARDEVRRLKILNGGRVPEGGVQVVFSDGEYPLPEPLELDARDSGAHDAAIVWKAENRGCVTFSGARKLAGWRPPSGKDADVIDLVPASARASAWAP